MRSFFILKTNEVRFIPNRAAAPLCVPTSQLLTSSLRRISSGAGLRLARPNQKDSFNRAETLLGDPTAVPEKRLAKLITLRQSVRFAA